MVIGELPEKSKTSLGVKEGGRAGRGEPCKVDVEALEDREDHAPQPQAVGCEPGVWLLVSLPRIECRSKKLQKCPGST